MVPAEADSTNRSSKEPTQVRIHRTTPSHPSLPLHSYPTPSPPRAHAHFRSSPLERRCACLSQIDPLISVTPRELPTTRAITPRELVTPHTHARGPHLVKLRPAHPSSCPTPVFTLFSEHTIPLYPHVFDRERGRGRALSPFGARDTRESAIGSWVGERA